MKAVLSQEYARLAKAGAKDEFHWDTVLKGFGLKVSKAAHKSWIFQRKVDGGPERRITLGSYPALHFEDARKKALSSANQVEQGEDPAVEAAKAKGAVTTVVELLQAYKAKPGVKDSYRRNIESTINNHISKASFAKWRVQDLDQPRLRKWLEDEYSLKSGVASNIIQHIRGAYGYGVAFGLIPKDIHNPATSVGRYLSFKLRKGTQALNMEDKELGDLLNAISDARTDRAFNPIAVAMVEMILHTGARKSEILSLRFDEIDAEKRTITKSDHKTSRQTGKPRTIHLSSEALHVLERAAEARKTMHRESKQWVFPAYRGAGHMADANRPVTQLGEKCGFPTLKPHNLRSLFINVALDAHVPLPIVAENVGHTNVDTTLGHYVKNKKSALMRGVDTVGIKLSALSKLAND